MPSSAATKMPMSDYDCLFQMARRERLLKAFLGKAFAKIWDASYSDCSVLMTTHPGLLIVCQLKI